MQVGSLAYRYKSFIDFYLSPYSKQNLIDSINLILKLSL